MTSQLTPRHSAHVYLRNDVDQYSGFLQHCLPKIALRCVQSGLRFQFLISPSTNFERSLKETLLILKLSLCLANYRHLASFDTVNDQYIAGLPINLFLFNPTLAVQRFATDDINLTDSVVTHGDISALVKVFNRIRQESQRRIELFIGVKELERFFDAYTTNDTFHGPRVLAQRFFGALTRPLADFEPHSEWYEWYQARKIVNIDVFGQGRLRTTIAFRNRLQIYPFRQICSKNDPTMGRVRRAR